MSCLVVREFRVLFFQFIFVGLTKGWNSSREEFCVRFYNGFRLTRASSEAQATVDEPNTNENEAEDRGILLDENHE